MATSDGVRTGPSAAEYDLRLAIKRLQQELNEATAPATVDALLAQLVAKQQELQAAEAAQREVAPAQEMILAPTTPVRDGTQPRGLDTTGLVATVQLRMAYTPTATYHLLDPIDHPLLVCEVQNVSSVPRRIRVTSFIDGYSARVVDTGEIPPKDKAMISQLPTLFPQRLRALHELTRATLNVLVEDLDGKVELQTTLPIWLLSRNSAPLAVRDPTTGNWNDLTRYLGAFVTPNAPQVMQFLRKAAKHHPDGQLVGNQDAVEPQVRAIYEALQQEAQITYVNSVVNFDPEEGAQTQRVRLPRQSLKEQQANCVDGVLLFASLLEAASLSPAILILPQHALIGYENGAQSGDWSYIETTMINGHSFAEALDIGQRKAAVWRKQFDQSQNPAYFRLWPLRDLRTQYHVTPLE